MACSVEGGVRWMLGLASIRWRLYPRLIPMSPILVLWTPLGSLMSSILRNLASTSKRIQTWKITNKECKTSINKQTILDGLVLLGDGLLSRLSLLRQSEVRFGWRDSIHRVWLLRVRLRWVVGLMENQITLLCSLLFEHERDRWLGQAFYRSIGFSGTYAPAYVYA